ncbi:winged helix-like dna-binding domain superfamily [Holotrichia oblita]|uniref:Winged helix-like dna-binding domain superfamily n=1 Tax=Holotrichia oblita TaxID=644536 RepID=A0ACB9T2T6_HOLOL|nr:winged helix-like dna-binding domain superfamily [Holotrichia oblita]
MAPPNKQSLRTAKLALAAITELRDDGQPATTDTISQHIQEEFEVPDREVTKYLSKALEKGVAFGAIKKMNGRYYLGSAKKQREVVRVTQVLTTAKLSPKTNNRNSNEDEKKFSLSNFEKKDSDVVCMNNVVECPENVTYKHSPIKSLSDAQFLRRIYPTIRGKNKRRNFKQSEPGSGNLML